MFSGEAGDAVWGEGGGVISHHLKKIKTDIKQCCPLVFSCFPTDLSVTRTLIYH